MSSLESRKAEFQAWLAAHVGIDLFTSQIVDAAVKIFTRPSFTVAISRTAIPDQEIHGITVAGDRKRLLGLQARVEKVMADGAPSAIK